MRSVLSIFVFFIFITLTVAPMVPDKCKIKYHYWRPFFGEHNFNDFIAATDSFGKHIYIAKIIPMTDSRSWTVSTQLAYDYAEFAWEDAEIRRVDRFMEVMVVLPQHRYRFYWTPIRSIDDLQLAIETRCAVEGGIIKFQDRIVYSYIGRIFVNGSFLVGAVWDQPWAMRCGLHYLDGWRKYRSVANYQLLVHEC